MLNPTIDTARRFVLFTYGSSVTFDEWREAMREVVRRPEFEPDFGFIMDRRAVKETPGADYIRQVVDYLDSHPEASGRWAVVVSDLVSYGMARMAQNLCNDTLHTNGRIVRSLEDAIAWVVDARTPP